MKLFIALLARIHIHGLTYFTVWMEKAFKTFGKCILRPPYKTSECSERGHRGFRDRMLPMFRPYAHTNLVLQRGTLHVPRMFRVIYTLCHFDGGPRYAVAEDRESISTTIFSLCVRHHADHDFKTFRARSGGATNSASRWGDTANSASRSGDAASFA